ncbi:MAG: acetyl-CoA carboxylase, carboxyltransferase subunit beta [Elusimicrobiota bacterium]|jgi:acetyl-CoA carboxylase carboxyl transferase subunit beta|nr:acetyl-CoA carboxylase, carboxyltransferase subunit beta [Elusimicrobiota bacterium]
MNDKKKEIIDESKKKELPEGLWVKCSKCEHILLKKEYDENFCVCPKCGHYERLKPNQRIEFLVDKKSFKEYDSKLKSSNFLDFPGYDEKIAISVHDGVVSGEAKIGGYPVIIAAMDFSFMGGSMGSVVGEKITRAVEAAIKKNRSLIIVCSSGGARMQEGIISLMQMAKTSAALAKLADSGNGYISILTDPTTGGVAASFAMLGDINISEADALVGFAGPRVIEQTIRQQLPTDFQGSKFLEKHGAVDIISDRKNLKNTVIKLLKFFDK